MECSSGQRVRVHCADNRPDITGIAATNSAHSQNPQPALKCLTCPPPVQRPSCHLTGPAAAPPCRTRSPVLPIIGRDHLSDKKRISSLPVSCRQRQEMKLSCALWFSIWRWNLLQRAKEPLINILRRWNLRLDDVNAVFALISLTGSCEPADR